ncbi:MarR family transcriptional regulator [Actinopolymorpha sp. B9G3]|uniref:MarR family winged helix-turn-helix transcriptional regulator n=1 Tax=Actinopolymorpha sp. B9G3 TaxID=3158970 RepID=UPI0032D96905
MTDGRQELVEMLVQEMPWYVSSAVRFQMAVADQLGMPLTDVHALGALMEFEPIGARRLADLMGMTTGAVTRIVDRLERGGYVRREPDPNDRRRIVLRLVPERVGQIARYYESMDVRWQRQIGGYTDAELRFLVEFLRRGGEYAQAETVALRARGRAHGTRSRQPRGIT